MALALRCGLAIALIVAVGVRAEDSVAAESTYAVDDIGSLIGSGDGQFDGLTNVQPVTVNENGDVVSNSLLPVGEGFWSVPFTSIDGKVRRLGRERAFSFALDMNDSAEIAGYVTSLDDVNFQARRAVMWRDREAFELPGLGGSISGAFGINERGEVIGDAGTESGEMHAVVWRDGEIEDLGTLGGANSFASDLNDAGAIVGQSNVSEGGGLYPCIWTDGVAAELPLPEGMRGYAAAINDDGVIVGVAISDANALSAVRWIEGDVETLPTIVEGVMSIAYDVNNDGVAAGWTSTGDASAPAYHAVIWDGDEVIDLNERLGEELGYALDTALSINDSGQILAAGTDAEGLRHGLLLSPNSEANRSVVANVASLSAWRNQVA